jgi:hypothetical protein
MLYNASMKTLNKKISLLNKAIKKAGSQADLAVQLTIKGKSFGFKIGQAGIAQWIARDRISPIGTVLIKDYLHK